MSLILYAKPHFCSLVFSVLLPSARCINYRKAISSIIDTGEK